MGRLSLVGAAAAVCLPLSPALCPGLLAAPLLSPLSDSQAAPRRRGILKINHWRVGYSRHCAHADADARASARADDHDDDDDVGSQSCSMSGSGGETKTMMKVVVRASC